MSHEGYYIHRDVFPPKGPFTLEQIKEFVAQGKLKGKDKARVGVRSQSSKRLSVLI